jgi:hypothetical protein
LLQFGRDVACDGLNSSAQRVIGEVGVSLGGGGLAVAKDAADQGETNALARADTRESVSQVVESNTRQSGLLPEPIPSPPNPFVWAIPACIWKHPNWVSIRLRTDGLEPRHRRTGQWDNFRPRLAGFKAQYAKGQVDFMPTAGESLQVNEVF